MTCEKARSRFLFARLGPNFARMKPVSRVSQVQ